MNQLQLLSKIRTSRRPTACSIHMLSEDGVVCTCIPHRLLKASSSPPSLPLLGEGMGCFTVINGYSFEILSHTFPSFNSHLIESSEVNMLVLSC